jgi:hypothetical protein
MSSRVAKVFYVAEQPGREPGSRRARGKGSFVFHAKSARKKKTGESEKGRTPASGGETGVRWAVGLGESRPPQYLGYFEIAEIKS